METTYEYNRYDADDSAPEPFFAIAQPCEGCGRPVDERIYNATRGLYLGWDCGCAPDAPDEQVCPNLYQPIMTARNVREIVAACKAHRESCEYCNPKVVRMQPRGQDEQESASRKKAA